MNDSKFFNLATARAICAQHPPTGECDDGLDLIDLSEYSYADPLALEYLASQGRRTWLSLGFNQIDASTAAILVQCADNLEFEHLEYLDQKTAAVLSITTNILSIGQLRDADIDAMEALAKCSGLLSLSFVGELTLDIANALTRHQHELFVRVPTPPPLHIQRALLFNYSGGRVSLMFPSGELCADEDLYLNIRKKITAELILDHWGQCWQHITAIDDVEKYQGWLNFAHPDPPYPVADE